MKVDPKLVAAARELRDRYLERVNREGRFVLEAAAGKYDVSRTLENRTPLPLLPAA